MARKRKGLTRKQMRVLPYFLSLLVITALLWLAVFGGTGFKGFPTPKLGLDLQGGMTMTLKASLPNGKTPSTEQLEQARQIIEDRVNGTGVAEPEVFVEGSDNIVVNVAGKQTNQEDLRKVGAPAELRFRQVIGTPVEDFSKQDPKKYEKKASGSGDSTDDASDKPSDGKSSDGKGDDKKSTCKDDADKDKGADASIKKKRIKVCEKLGNEQWTQAKAWIQQEQAQEKQTQQPMSKDVVKQYGLMKIFKPFGELAPDEVAALPADMQYYVPTIGCGQLNARTPGSISQPGQQVTACNRPSSDDEAKAKKSNKPAPYVKYTMDKSNVSGKDVSSSAVQPDQQKPGKWAVSLSFNGKGTDKWVKLASDSVGKSVAIVLDNQVVSAPTIQEGAASGGSVSITGDFNNDDAKLLSEQLKYGALPAAFKVETIDVVSATLGIEQLKAGLFAGGLGLLLVVLYCLAYYRFLGVVVIASLVVSTLITYPMVVLLGQQIGLTLTLAGIAGFIVAIGITADAFVVMFERLKDEIKEGRSARSAVPRAWVRARRTIVSANVVNFLSAVVLYILGIGVVKGFAFALGLSTIAGMVLVFLFTHPLVSLISRGKVLDSRRMSGIHVGTSSATKPTVGSVRAEAKE